MPEELQNGDIRGSLPHAPKGMKDSPSTSVLALWHHPPDGKGAGPVSLSHPLAPLPSVLSELMVQNGSEVRMKPNNISAQRDTEDSTLLCGSAQEPVTLGAAGQRSRMSFFHYSYSRSS